MKTLRIIKKGSRNEAVAVISVERLIGFIPVQERVVLMACAPSAKAGNTQEFDEKEFQLEPSDPDRDYQDGDLEWFKLVEVA